MSGDCNIYGGFKKDSATQTAVYWGDILGDINSQSDLQSTLGQKVDIETGKILSSNDFTDFLKTKLERSKTVYELCILPENWEFLSEDIYIHTIKIPEIKETDSAIADIFLSDDETTAILELDCWSKIIKIDINNGNIVAYCRNNTPNIVLNIKIMI